MCNLCWALSSLSDSSVALVKPKIGINSIPDIALYTLVLTITIYLLQFKLHFYADYLSSTIYKNFDPKHK